ncbi:MAG: hypothetical protein KJ060_18640, partial [Candidatus Hydrogenedentes bacterium]|nr:hypothetical protein [Candidatus Hydrogenedentota bacterium]
APLDRVYLRASVIETVTNATLMFLFVAAILASSLSLWFLHAPHATQIVLAALVVMIGAKAGIGRRGSSIVAWWRGDPSVHLHIFPQGPVGQIQVRYEEGSSPILDTIVGQIRSRQAAHCSSSPFPVRFTYFTTRADVVRLLADQIFFGCIAVPTVVGNWGSYLGNLLIAVLVPLYLIGMLLISWRYFTRRKLKVAEAALFDGDYEEAALVLSGLPERTSRRPPAMHLAAMLAMLRSDLVEVADALADLERAKAFLLGVVVMSNSVFCRRFSASPPPPYRVRTLALYNDGLSPSDGHYMNTTSSEIPDSL